MKTIYGIKQKYNLKDYVEYYQSTNGKGQHCDEQFGYINKMEYRCNTKGDIELVYVVSDFVGSSSGFCVKPENIIRRATPKVPNYGLKEFLENKIKTNERHMERLEEQIKQDTKALKELTNND